MHLWINVQSLEGSQNIESTLGNLKSLDPIKIEEFNAILGYLSQCVFDKLELAKSNTKQSYFWFVEKVIRK